MRAWKTAVAVALALGGLLAGATARGPAIAQETVTWQSSLATAERLARESGKPIFLVFR